MFNGQRCKRWHPLVIRTAATRRPKPINRRNPRLCHSRINKGFGFSKNIKKRKWEDRTCKQTYSGFFLPFFGSLKCSLCSKASKCSVCYLRSVWKFHPVIYNDKMLLLLQDLSRKGEDFVERWRHCCRGVWSAFSSSRADNQVMAWGMGTLRKYRSQGSKNTSCFIWNRI